MRQCIFCGQFKKDSEFNKEHIILDSLGGKGNEDICKNVCTSFNSSLGTRVDACLTNHNITKYLRFLLKIRGKNGVPNPFKNVKVNYDSTILKGELQTDSQGNLIGFRADHSAYEVGSKIIIAGPRKEFAKYVNSQLKRRNFPTLSERYIYKNALHIKNPKVPHLDKIEFQESEITSYLHFAYSAMLKMAYEFCFVELGEHYLDDPLAKEVREFLMKFDYKKCSEYFVPTDAELKWNDNYTRIVSLKIHRKCNELYVKVDLYGTIVGVLCMSKSANEYGEIKGNILQIEL